jgi:putative oxidoreductase
MNEQTLSRIAVIILAIVLIVFGIYHFMQPRIMMNFVPNFLPGGILWVYVVGITFILAGISFILHKWVKIAGYLLALLLICFVLLIHLPNYLHSGDINEQRMSFMNLLKDSAIAAFAMYIASNAQKI